MASKGMLKYWKKYGNYDKYLPVVYMTPSDDGKRGAVVIDKYGENWQTTLETTNPRKVLHREIFKTRTEALNYAKKYMSAHLWVTYMSTH